MAQKRAPLAFNALDDLHTDLTPLRDRQEPVEPSSDDLPAPSNQVRTFHSAPLAAQSFPAAAKAAAKDRLVSYSVRLRLSQVEELERLKAERGIVPSELLRDFVDRCLPQV